MSEETDQLIAEAEMGEQARKFLESELYQVMNGFAEQEVRLALELLETVDPTDTKEITNLQNNIKVGKWFTKWLEELVYRGDQAISVFNQQRE